MRNSWKALVIVAVLVAVGMLLVVSNSKAAALISTGDGGWEQVYPLGPLGVKAFFLDENTGWVITGGCRFLKTTDGGRNWASQGQAIHKFLSDVCFTDKDHGWAVGRGPASSDPTGIILKTDNGGATWRAVINGKIDGLDAVSFVNNSVGWAVGGYPGNKGVVLKTTDGGETWVEKRIPLQGNDSRRFMGVSFPNESTGYVMAFFRGGVDIFKTTDGGETWSHSPGVTQGYPPRLQFVDANTGWILTDKSLLRTMDGGATWTKIGKGMADDKGKFPYSVHFSDARCGVAVSRSRVLYTRDGGETWKSPDGLPDMIADGPQVFMADNKNAWITGGRGTMRTSDGGATWQDIARVRYSNIVQVAFSKPKVALANGSDSYGEDKQGVLLRTEDGGLTWSRQLVKETRWIIRSCFPDATAGWATTEEGNVLKTTDGGATWQVRKTNEKAYAGVSFADALNGWAVGGDGTIVHTSDGGENWEKQNSGRMDYLHDVFFANDSTGWVCGQGGAILKTTDGGNTWVRKASGTNGYLAAMQFIGDSTGWVSGSRGCVLKTTDGGETWTKQKSGAEDQLTGICFINENEGWAGGGSTVVHTADGGETWQAQYPGPSNIWDLAFEDSDSGLAVCPRTILRTTTGGLPGAVWARKQEDGKRADFGHLVVTKKSEGYLLAEHPDSRISIRIKTSDTKPNAGDYIYIHGRTATENGEKIIAADSIDIMCAGWGVLP